MDAEPTDKVGDVVRRVACDSERDAFVVFERRVLRRSDEMKGCGISDGGTLQVMSKVRGGRRHKNKTRQRERKKDTCQRRPEQKSDEEPKNVKDLVMQECNKELMIRTLQENEENRKIIESMAEGSDAEMERTLQNYRTAGREVLGCEQSQNMAEVLEWGFRCAVDARRKRRQAEQNAGTGKDSELQ